MTGHTEVPRTGSGRAFWKAELTQLTYWRATCNQMQLSDVLVWSTKINLTGNINRENQLGEVAKSLHFFHGEKNGISGNRGPAFPKGNSPV